MLFTLQAVKDNLRNREGKRVFYLGSNDRLTAEAKDYLQANRIQVLSSDMAKPSRYRLLTGGYVEEKPEHMTHLHDDVLVEKTHPRIAFRGAVDTLEAELLLQMLYLPDLQKELQQVLSLARQLIACDVLQTPVQQTDLGGLTAEQIRYNSHFPQKVYGVAHFMPQRADGEKILRLNRLRCICRNAERSAVAAFFPDRTDIITALNRMSSYLYILMLQAKSSQ